MTACVFAKGSAYSVFVWITRNRRRRAKALLDFERHDDDELGFRKNDIVTVSCLSTVCKAEHGWNVQTVPTIMQKTFAQTQCSSSLSLIEWWLSVLLNSTRMWRIVLAHFAINCAYFKELLQDPFFKTGLSGGKPVENRKFKLQVSSESKSNPGARFSKVPRTFRARKASRKTMTCLFCKACLFICCKGNKNKNNCKVSCLETPSFWRYKENCVTRNTPEKFRDFRETGPRTQEDVCSHSCVNPAALFQS